MKNIIILSDGTGNAAASVWRTNVWRTFQSLNLRSNNQVAKYDDGVGTSSFVPLAILGGAFGWGLKRNVLDAYKFVCRNYVPGDKLFMFGFSRGAFTIRVLNALILEQGLVRADQESELHDLARKAYRTYRARGYHSIWGIERPLRAIRDFFSAIRDKLSGRRTYDPTKNVEVSTVEFLGLWDTVAAYGLPADEMTRGFSRWIWPLELPDRELSGRVKFARHALAIDDERTTFHPVLWTEKDEPVDENVPVSDRRLLQVWFVGMHSNVGGGYPDDAVAHVALLWMMKEAALRGLVFKQDPNDDPDALRIVQSAEDKDGRLYNSRSGLGGYYRYGPRKIADLCNDKDHNVFVPTPKIHDSVFGRIDSGCNAYAPIVLPSRYVTLTGDGRLVPPGPGQYETEAQAVARAAAQERIWNYVWMRRIAYFLTLAATFHLVAFWLFHPLDPAREFDSPIRLVSETVRLVESLLPKSLHWWFDSYAANPVSLVVGVLAVAVFTAAGSSLSSRISDLMRTVWASKGARDPVPVNAMHRGISALRSNPAYTWSVWAVRRHILPFLFFLSVLWAGLTFGSHLLFNIADSAGAFCRGDEKSATPVDKGIDQNATQTFATSDFCMATKLKVRRDFRYEITVLVQQPWADGSWVTDPVGFRTSGISGWSRPLMYLGVPLRRVIFRPWFRLIARIGEQGTDEYFLDPVRMVETKTDPVTRAVTRVPTNVYKARFKASRDGEVFLYVNDAALSLPWFYDRFFRYNKGTATIAIKLL